MRKRILEKATEIIRMFNILSDDKEIGGNLILWTFIKLFTNLEKLKQASAALTYHTIFAIVPVMALFVAVAKLMGYGDAFRGQVELFFHGHEGIAEYLLEFAESYLINAQFNYWLGAGVGLLFLIYSLFSIFQTVDNSFNSLWNLPGHSLKKQLYVFIFVLLVPFVGMILLAVWLSISSYFDSDGLIREINMLVLTSGIYVAFMFLAYKYIPNTKVETRYAFKSALACGLTFGALQYFGFMIMGMFSSYRNIYGGLASLILFILWIYFSWTICLAGSRWNYLLQEGKRLDMENKFKAISHNYRKFLALLLLARAAKLSSMENTFTHQQIVEDASNTYNLPAHITMDIIDELSRRGILWEDTFHEDIYCIKRDFLECDIPAIISKLDSTGDNGHTMEMTLNVHTKGKEARLWECICKGMEKREPEFNKTLKEFL